MYAIRSYYGRRPARTSRWRSPPRKSPTTARSKLRRDGIILTDLVESRGELRARSSSGRRFAVRMPRLQRISSLDLALADTNAVFLEGSVLRPGRYELKPGLTVGDRNNFV